MADEISDYGVKFYRANDSGSMVIIGNVADLDYPAISNPAVESTHHSSGGRKEFISSGLVEFTEFKVTLNDVFTSGSVILADVLAGTSRTYQIDTPIDGESAWEFTCIATNYKKLKSDASKPQTSKVEVTFRPSGSAVLLP